MKYFITLFLVFNIHILTAQVNNTVVLTVSGVGKTQQEAKFSALRLAIEQAFGAFISSKSDMLNDKVFSDQITSISNGNIQSFEILNETQLPSGDWSMILKATVSLNKLTNFVQSRGVTIDVNGGLFVINIKQQILNEQSEVKSMFDLVSILHENLQNAFDYEIENNTPIIINGDNNMWKIPLKVSAIANKNINFCNEFLIKTLNSISLKENEVKTYKEMGKEVFTIYVGDQGTPFFLRNKESLKVFNTILDLGKFYPSLFKTINADTKNLKKNYFVHCEGFSDYKKLNEFVKKMRPIDIANKNNQLFILPKVNSIFATYTWSDTLNLEQLEKIKSYSVGPIGVKSFIKDGGFLIEDDLGNKLIVALFDQEPLNRDTATNLISNKKTFKELSIVGYKNWRIPSIKELNIIDLKMHSEIAISPLIFTNFLENNDKIYLGTVDKNGDSLELEKDRINNILFYHFINPSFFLASVKDPKKKLALSNFLRNNSNYHLCHSSENCTLSHGSLSIGNKVINLRLVKNYDLGTN